MKPKELVEKGDEYSRREMLRKLRNSIHSDAIKNQIIQPGGSIIAETVELNTEDMK